MNSFDLLRDLKQIGYLKDGCEKLWWKNSGTFEVVVGAILTQMTKWSSVELSLDNLKNHSMLDIKTLSNTDKYVLSDLIKPSGFSMQKSSRLILLSQNILGDFQTFEIFQEKVDKEWLLSQKGLGHESADAILCYACLRDVMVVDSYTIRLLEYYGYEFEAYEEVQEWFYSGILDSWDKVEKLYGGFIDKSTLWARFHGKIVEFCKEHMRGKKLETKILPPHK